ncbi:uncharacterized protein A1O9_09875 [Exophiala aquamarina CBS 119918]|uniref:Major facilitator superfamily (MFS) profile domain-containing protein n=1 Tax=Exophiala aquamarina CBS 119918 TaxID=1182545 RepID=A0A072PES4_9EURO|nr:uncharacterized protein A1O9_09875 [Exophiala aquamarina CBS 119918]KEF54080.1 hypothetical protein A1O9_09875 [Exophiala aquamarina CBS 119918]
MLIFGICFLVAFSCFETWGKSDGLLDHRFLESRNFMLILSVGFVDGMLLYGVNVFFPVEVEAIFTNNLLLAGVYLLPMNIAVLVGCFFSARFLHKTRRYRSVLVIALIIIALFLGLLALVTPSRLAMACAFTGLVGLGVNVATVLPPTILSYSVPSHLFGTGGTLLASTRALGGTVGITIFSTIYGNKMKGKPKHVRLFTDSARSIADLPPSVAEAAIAAGLPPTSAAHFLAAYLGPVGSVVDVSGVTPKIIEAATSAVADTSARSFRYVWFANMAIAVATAAVCVFLRPIADEMTEHVESALEVSDLRTEQMQKVKTIKE